MSSQARLFHEELTREHLNSLVDKAADIIRTATDYKFILVLLFLKRVSDTWKEEYEEKKSKLLEYLDEDAAEKEAENEVYHTFNLRRELLWDNVTKDLRRLPEDLSNALIRIGDLNRDLKGVIDKFSFLGFTSQEHREKLRQLVELFNQYNLGNQFVSGDIIGDAYEHILYRFAPAKAKEGEIYTPREVIQLIIELTDPKPGQSVYDPACGSGGMLIGAYKHAKERYGKAERLLLFGQEYSTDMYGFCRLNLIAHGITDAFLEFGDSLLYPRFTEEGKLKQFDVVVANPPWNQDGYGEQTLKTAEFRNRYSLGYLPNSTADWAWVQHMLASSTQNVGVILDRNALHRGGSEYEIRKQIIERDLIDTVILLPPKLFYNTPSSGIILILEKEKVKERRGKILVINAIEEFARHPQVRRLNILFGDNMKRIVSAYEEFQDVDGLAKVVNTEEVKKNDYDLNVSLYVTPLIQEEEIDLGSVYEDINLARSEFETVWEDLSTRIEAALRQVSEDKPRRELRYSDDLGFEIPADWKVMKVDDLFKVETGTTPSTKKEQYWDDGTVVWITPLDLSNLNGNLYIKDSDRKVTEEALRDYSLTVLPEGSIILSTRAPVGYAAVTSAKATFNQGCKGLVPKNAESVVPEFYNYYFTLQRRKLESMSSGATFQELSKKWLANLPIPVPPKKDQKRVVAALLSIERIIAATNGISHRLGEIRRWFMRHLLLGEIGAD